MKFWNFLFESDLPVGLQVFWKLLAAAMAVILVWAAITSPALSTWQATFMYVLAGCFVVIGLFTKLGDG